MSEIVWLNDYQKHMLGAALADETHSAYVLRFLIPIDNSHTSIEQAQSFLDQLAHANPIFKAKLKIDGTNAKYDFSNLNSQASIVESNSIDLYSDFNQTIRFKKLNILNDPLANFFLFIEHKNVIGIGFQIHHIIFDAESFNILWSLCKSFFSKENTELPNSNYFDFSPPIADRLTLHEKYWESQLADFQKHKTHNLVTESQISSGYFTTYQADKTNITNFCSTTNVSLPQALLAAIGVVLSAFKRRDQIYLGTVVSVRSGKFQNTIGNFINTIPLVLDLKNYQTLSDIAIEAKRIFMLCLRHANLPFVDIFKKMPLNDSHSSEVFDSFFSYRKANHLTIQDIKTGWHTNLNSKFSLNFEFIEASDGLILRLNGSKDYPSHVLESLSQAFWRLINNSEVNLNRTHLFSDEKIEVCPYPVTTSVFNTWLKFAAETPDKIAFHSLNQSLSFSQALKFSYSVNAKLDAMNIPQGSRIAVIVDRSIYFVPTLIGIWLSGHSAVPVDIRWPDQRKKQVTHESGTEVSIILDNSDANTSPLIVQLHELIKSAETIPLSLPPIDRYLHHEAYLLFTSGTTNVPKGVSVSHKNILVYTEGLLKRIPGVSNCQSIAVVSSLAADLGYTSIFLAMALGKSLSVFDYNESIDPELFTERIQRDKVDLIKIVPTHFASLLSSHSGNAARTIPSKIIIFGGEALNADLVDKLKLVKPEITIINHYGPTETTVGILANTSETRSFCRFALGKPISSYTTILLCDHRHRIVPNGFPGEIVVIGPQVSRGYINSSSDAFCAVRARSTQSKG